MVVAASAFPGAGAWLGKGSDTGHLEATARLCGWPGEYTYQFVKFPWLAWEHIPFSGCLCLAITRPRARLEVVVKGTRSR